MPWGQLGEDALADTAVLRPSGFQDGDDICMLLTRSSVSLMKGSSASSISVPLGRVWGLPPTISVSPRAVGLSIKFPAPLRTAFALMLSRRSVVLLADCAEPVVASVSGSSGLPLAFETGPAPGASRA